MQTTSIALVHGRRMRSVAVGPHRTKRDLHGTRTCRTVTVKRIVIPLLTKSACTFATPRSSFSLVGCIVMTRSLGDDSLGKHPSSSGDDSLGYVRCLRSSVDRATA